MTEAPKGVNPPAPTKEEMEYQMKLQGNMFTVGLPSKEQITKENAKMLKESMENVLKAIKFSRGFADLVKETGFVYLPFQTVVSQRSMEVATLMNHTLLEMAKQQVSTAGIAMHFEKLIEASVSDIPFATKHVNDLIEVCEKLLA